MIRILVKVEIARNFEATERVNSLRTFPESTRARKNLPLL